MKTLKIWIVAMLSILVLPTIAQEAPTRGGDHEERKTRMMEKLTTELALTDQQQIEVGRIMDENHQKRQALREADRQEREAAMKEHMAAMKQILDEDQFAKYQQMASERRKKMQERKARKM